MSSYLFAHHGDNAIQNPEIRTINHNEENMRYTVW
jgi:hypothetical protein